MPEIQNTPVAMKSMDPAWGQIMAAWKWFLSRWKILIQIAAIAALPSIVSSLLSIFKLSTLDFTYNPWQLATFGLAALAWLIVSIVFSIYGSLALYMYILSDNPHMTLGGAFQAARGKIGRYFSVSVVVGLIVLAGFIVFIIPGIYFGVIYTFALVVALDQNKKVGEAMRTSKSLVQGYWWAVLGRFALYCIAIFLGSMIIGFIGGLIGGFGGTNSFFYLLITNLLGIALNLVITPFAVIFSVELYRNLKKLKGV